MQTSNYENVLQGHKIIFIALSFPCMHPTREIQPNCHPIYRFINFQMFRISWLCMASMWVAIESIHLCLSVCLSIYSYFLLVPFLLPVFCVSVWIGSAQLTMVAPNLYLFTVSEWVLCYRFFLRTLASSDKHNTNFILDVCVWAFAYDLLGVCVRSSFLQFQNDDE